MAIPSGDYGYATIQNPNSALTNYALLIDLSRQNSLWWSEVNTSDGTRGRAAKNDGTTELACAWFNFNNSAETGWLLVQWSGTLAASGTQIIRIYPPNTANSAYVPSATYGAENVCNSNCLNYCPMYESSTPLYDITSAGNNIVATGTGLTFGSSGKAGLSLLNDGSNPVASLTIDLSAETTIIVDAWVYWDTFANDDDLLFEYTLDADTNSGFVVNPNASTGVINVVNHDVGYNFSTYTRHSGGSWHKITAVFDMTQAINETDLYVDGVFQTPVSRNAVKNNVSWDNSVLYLLSRAGTSHAAAASIQHLAIYTTRSADEIAEDFDQADNQSTFWGTWAWSGAALVGNPWYYYSQQ